MIKNNILKVFPIFLIFAISSLLFSCGGGDDPEAEGGRWENMNEGKLTVLCEEGAWNLMQKPFKWYSEFYPKVELTPKKVNTHEAMKKLLAGDTIEGRAIIIARGYTKREDSLMKKFRVEKHQREPLARDGLVFFVQEDYPIDTLKASDLEALLTDDSRKISDFNPKISEETLFATNSHNSSEYVNFKEMVLRGKKMRKKLKLFQSADSVKEYVAANKNAVGIGYLGQVVKDGRFKCLALGYTDSTGKYINAKPVHQGYIVQGLYPYIVTYYVYLAERQRNLPYWFAMYVARETKVQRYFLDHGIVPAYAKIHLIPEEY